MAPHRFVRKTLIVAGAGTVRFSATDPEQFPAMRYLEAPPTTRLRPAVVCQRDRIVLYARADPPYRLPERVFRLLLVLGGWASTSWREGIWSGG